MSGVQPESGTTCDAQEIIKGVWLGSSQSADVCFLQALGIKNVINVTVKVPFPPGTRCKSKQAGLH